MTFWSSCWKHKPPTCRDCCPDTRAYDVLAWCRDITGRSAGSGGIQSYTPLRRLGTSILAGTMAVPYQGTGVQAKMMSLLVPDTAIPYDTASLTAIEMHSRSLWMHSTVSLKHLRQYCIGVLEGGGIDLDGFRHLDAPGDTGTFHPGLITRPKAGFVYGTGFLPLERPISRVVDKILYQPGFTRERTW